MADIDHEYTDEVVCPHCGYKHQDSYEFFIHNDECSDTNCHSCNKPFTAIRHVNIYYSTIATPEVADGAE